MMKVGKSKVTEANRLRVFISSTIDDLKEERSAVEQTIRELRYDAVKLEDMGSMSASALEASLLFDDRSDIYLGIIGGRYGNPPLRETRSVTELEFWRAHEIHLPTLVYVKEMDETAREEQEKEFLKRVQKVVKHATPFKTMDELVRQVRIDLDRLVAEIVRSRQLPRTRPTTIRNVLIASLGRAPGAVTGLLHGIQEQLHIHIDEVVTLSAKGSRPVQLAANLLEQEFAKLGVIYRAQVFDAVDMRYDDEVLKFKIALLELLNQYQNEGAEVFLGIAGGRASMGALTAMVATVEAQNAMLFHFWVPDDIEQDGDIENYWTLSDARQRQVLFPSEYALVKVPYFRARQR